MITISCEEFAELLTFYIYISVEKKSHDVVKAFNDSEKFFQDSRDKDKSLCGLLSGRNNFPVN